MRWFDFGREAVGFVAVGQFATGVIAVGQFAWGVVAVGQVAIGWFAIGQIAIGGLTAGLVGVGLHATAAMIGVGGRGRGWVLELLPRLAQRQAPKGIESVRAVRGRADGGWVRIHLEPGADSRIALFDGSERLRDVRLDARVRRAALQRGRGEVWAELRHAGAGMVAHRLIEVPTPRTLSPTWWIVWGLQLMALFLVSGVVWGALGEVLIATLGRAGG